MPAQIKKNKGRVLVAMSGGVDSSVTAQLLKDQGYEVAGVFLHFWRDEAAGCTRENRCCSLAAAADAQAVADKIGCHLYNFNFAEPFKTAVVDNFLEEYAAGRTPNPCVRCNKQIKIGRLLKYAAGLGFAYVATGHYVKITHGRSGTKLYRARDKKKDQSYFLYTFSPKELQHLLFPLASAETSCEVRIKSCG
jgi:tRNA-specific 2-thiouridylase